MAKKTVQKEEDGHGHSHDHHGHSHDNHGHSHDSHGHSHDHGHSHEHNDHDHDHEDHSDDDDNHHGHSHNNTKPQQHGHSHDGKPCTGHGGGGESEKPEKSTKTFIKFGLLFLLVPTFFGLPFILKRAGEIVANNRVYLIYIWAIYAVVLTSVIYMKRHLQTINSFVNQNLIWVIFTLGVFIFLDIPKMIQQVDLRTEVLYVWCTITMIPNIIFFFFDDTDHKTLERIEEEKEEKKKKKDNERRARQDEKRKAKIKEKMKKYSSTQLLVMNTAVYLGIAILVALLGYQTYRWYIKTQQNIIERNRMATEKSEYVGNDFDIDG
ncbi:hypothetical protein DICPUDRAFT_92387 [Dictyostelium purpureum]|uniref:Uncharacterized protein n=1 Tax=Dictyostelium purpureum TaxID=5786 RepID=F0ZR82_DICPU|nr:uncharacterized protein DICPUDRAFT_92387 [Dictyostelium purpureum]EGC33539.1 hypothetical protein DICPUDRAFT_92387 [Dictyostelium purpureum]|eukprot:XP_003289921.1 hypothetical protein DICPUDRAFT_92387 [Dictyostelium purpureum]